MVKHIIFKLCVLVAILLILCISAFYVLTYIQHDDKPQPSIFNSTYDNNLSKPLFKKYNLSVGSYEDDQEKVNSTLDDYPTYPIFPFLKEEYDDKELEEFEFDSSHEVDLETESNSHQQWPQVTSLMRQTRVNNKNMMRIIDIDSSQVDYEKREVVKKVNFYTKNIFKNCFIMPNDFYHLL